MKKIFVLFVAILMICTFAACSIKNNEAVVSYNSPDGKYTVSLYQAGDPQWPFGPVKAKLVLKNTKGRTLDKVTFWLDNDGGGVALYNLLDIDWMEDHAEIKMQGIEAYESEIYTLKYK